MAQTSRTLVGRDAELSDLTSHLGGRHVLLAGDAGVGKTRLLRELGGVARAHGWEVHAGHCLDFGDSGLPYLPFSEILDRLTTAHADLVADVELAHPALARLRPTSRQDATPVDRGQLFTAVHALLAAAGTVVPTLVVLEDVHWADQSTRDLITLLLTRPFEAPVTIVVSYRSDDLHRRHPLRRQVAEWSRLPAVERVALEPLGDDAVRDLVSHLDPAVLEQEREDIVARAEGNAFFVEELVGAATGPEHWMPEQLADVLLVRLDRLDDASRNVVRTVSVAGRRVRHELLAEVAGLGPDALDEALRHAVESHVLVAGEGAYWFRHALLGEAVYDDLLPGERVRLHARYAAALVRNEGCGSAAELARHARLALDLDTALVASIRAGEEAAGLGGPDEAAAHYERALAILGERPAPDGVRRAAVIGATVVALTAAGRPERAAAVAEEQLALLDRGMEEPTDAERAGVLTVAAIAAGLLNDLRTDPLELSSRAVALVADESPALQARLLANHAQVLYWVDRPAEAQAAGLQALALAERNNLPAIASAAATTLTALSRLGDQGELREALRAAIGRAQAAGELRAELQGHFLLARSHEDAGEWAEAEVAFRAGIDRATAAGQPWAPYGFESRHQLAWVLYVLGRWDEALELTALARPGAPPVGFASLDSTRLMIRQGRGEPVPRRIHRDLWPVDGIVPVFTAGVEMVAAGRAGDVADVLRVYDEVVDVLTQAWGPWFQARVRLAAVGVGVLADAMAVGTPSARSALLAEADRLAADGAATYAHSAHTRAWQQRGHRQQDDEGEVNPRGWGPEGEAWRVRLVAEQLRAHWAAGGSVDAAELVDAWRGAEAAFVAMGHVVETAAVRATLATILGATGDTAAAREVADQARVTAEALGLRPVLDVLPTAVRAPAAADALTRRESEILALVAEGLSNGEVGKRLFISTKTVSVHVSNVLAKLGASGRTEAAAIARRRGILD